MMTTCRRRMWIWAVFAAFAACNGYAADPPASIDVKFHDIESGQAAIVDESVEPYFTLLGPLEMSVKTGEPITGESLDQQREETRKRYRAAVMAFTEDEKATLRFYIEKLDPILGKHYPKFANVPWKFVKVAAHIEGGLPHTRGDTIVLSGPALDMLANFRRLPGQFAVAHAAGLLIHEKLHVMQRLEPELFEPLFTEVWGFEKAGKIELTEVIDRRVIVNPDGVDLGWVYPIKEGNATRTITPRIVFRGGVEKPRMPDDFQMIAVEVRREGEGFVAVMNERGEPVFKALGAEKNYLTPGLRLSSIYHPNEIAADAFAHIIVGDHLLPAPGAKKDDDLAPTRRWFAENFK